MEEMREIGGWDGGWREWVDGKEGQQGERGREGGMRGEKRALEKEEAVNYSFFLPRSLCESESVKNWQ